jgi:hypothetical protein
MGRGAFDVRGARPHGPDATGVASRPSYLLGRMAAVMRGANPPAFDRPVDAGVWSLRGDRR